MNIKTYNYFTDLFLFIYLFYLVIYNFCIIIIIPAGFFLPSFGFTEEHVIMV